MRVRKPPPHGFGGGINSKSTPTKESSPGHSSRVYPTEMKGVNVRNFKAHFDPETLNYVTEDTRLSTLQRKLVRETNVNVALCLAFQIRQCILSLDNRTYVKRASDIIMEAVVEVLQSGKHAENVKIESAKALGSAGFVLTEMREFDKFYDWIWQRYEDAPKGGLPTFLLTGLVAFLEMQPPHLNSEQLNRILTDVQVTLESTNDSKVMMTLVDSLVLLSNWRPTLFEPCFQDVVDILVGWHIDSCQSPQVRSFVSKTLLSWHAFWILDMEFSSVLLRQFMEDFQEHFYEVQQTEDLPTLDELSQKILALIQVLNTVLSCLKNQNHSVSFLPPESSDWCLNIMECLVLTLNKIMCEDLLVAGQHTFVMFLERIETLFQAHHDKFMGYIQLNLDCFRDMSFYGQISVLEFLAKMYSLADAPRQPWIATLVTDFKSPVFEVALGSEAAVSKAAADLFKILLMSKNIHILQDVYSYLNCLFEKALHTLCPDLPGFLPTNKLKDSDFNIDECQSMLNFALASFSSLATGTGSNLSIWALDPPIFQLLLQHGGLGHPPLIRIFPWIHLATFKLLFSHCKKHGFFLSSSNLTLHSSLPKPTSDYFTQMLSFLGKLLKPCILDLTNRQLLLTWTREILLEVHRSQKYLLNCEEYLDFLSSILDLALKIKDPQGQETLFNLILGVPGQFTSMEHPKMTMKLFHLAKSSLSSAHHGVSEKALSVISALPPLSCHLKIHAQPQFEFKQTLLKKHILHHNTRGAIRTSDFKVFLEHMLKSPVKKNSKVVEQVVQQLDCHFHDFPLNLGEVVVDDLDLRTLWMSLALSEFCVNNKLKTPLGNANTTLTTIEKVIRSVSSSWGEESNINFQEARHLLVFFESLEKIMANCYDGSSVFLPAPSKVIVNFFVANKKTCSDWLLRLRGALIDLAFQLNELEVVIRNAYELLARLVELKQTSDVQFMRALVSLSLALTKLGASEELIGLYTWTVMRSGKKHYWIKSLSLLAADKVEDGIKSLNASLRKALEGNGIDQFQFLAPLTLELQGNLEIYSKWMSDYRERLPKQESQVSELCLKALSEFHDGVVQVQVSESSEFFRQDFIRSPKSVPQKFQASQLILLQSAQRFPNVLQRLEISEILETSKSIIDQLLKECRLTPSQERELLILNAVQNEFDLAMRNEEANLDTFLSFQNERYSVRDLMSIKRWGDFLLKNRKTKNTGYNYQKLNSLNLEIAKTARKEGNLALTEKFLKKTLMGEIDTTNTSIEDHLMKLDFRTSMLSIERASCLRQSAKLAFKAKNELSAVRVLSGIATRIGDMFFHDTANTELMDISSRALHNMAQWFLNDPTLLDKVFPDMPLNTLDGITLIHVLNLEQRAAGALDFLPMVEEAGDSDMVIGRLLRLAVVQSPQLGKIWYTFAEWALALGEKVLGSSHISILEEERQAVIEALPDATKTELDEIFRLLQQFKLGHTEKAGVETDCEEFMRKELMDCEALARHDASAVNVVYDVWLGIQKRTFFYHEIAISSFFQFIALSQSEGDQLITATLRLLRLTVMHALELQESLQAGLETTPCSRWKAIIPQLFSRLNHPVRIVRNRISELICRIAEDYSHLIIYPAIVGGGSSSTATNKISKLLAPAVSENEDLGDDEDETNGHLEEEEEANPLMESAFAHIVDVMVKKNGTTVKEIRDFIAELQRISLLWDELWLGTLQQYSQDILKRVRKMELEVEKLKKNRTLKPGERVHLAQKKYHIIFRPVLYVLDRVFALTSRVPETPHEQHFLDNYVPVIKDVIEFIRHPPDPTKPKMIGEKLAQFQAKMANRVQCKSLLKLSEISPNLARLKGTQIPMPGILSKHEITVQSFEETLIILLTKTKPKKLVLVGSDGKKYPYLFKGLEDLHLDERIMQFISIANIMMGTKSDSSYKARHYSVVPLGPRSGLIQWVRDAIPMYSLFKKWQQRQQLAHNDKKNQEKRMIAFQKPSEFYCNKLYKLLKEYGVSVDNRKAWPPAMMQTLLNELIVETPDNIIAQELWFSSVDSKHWFNLMQSMTRSVAVMSVIGYIIGLGDRHMDNLMVDMTHGEIIHIDYNVCFEKGKQLKIPERVPCRLTQNIVKIFGLNGVEGLFRKSCEHTLDAMRRGKDTLLTLLEAFVYDPLVDWTPEVMELGLASTYQAGRPLETDMQDKRNMQCEITFSMFAVRIAEMKGPWMANKIKLSELLSNLDYQLTLWADLQNTLDGFTENKTQLHHAVALLKEAESNPDHRLFSLHDKYIEHSLMETALKGAKTKVELFMDENEHWITLHQRALTNVSVSQLSEWSKHLQSNAIGSKRSSHLVQEFLENAGQAGLFDQYQSTEERYCGTIEQLQHSVGTILQHLATYCSISSFFPLSIQNEHRCALYKKWALRLLEDLSLETSSVVIAEFTEKFVDLPKNQEFRKLEIVNNFYQMNAWMNEVQFKVQAMYGWMSEQELKDSTFYLAAWKDEKIMLEETIQREGQGAVMGQLVKAFESLRVLEHNATKDPRFLSESVPGSQWKFQDDIFLRINQVSIVSNILQEIGALDESNPGVTSLLKAQSAIKQLTGLNTNFHNIVLYEALKCFDKEDPTMTDVVLQLSGIINGSSTSLEDHIKNLNEIIQSSESDAIESQEKRNIIKDAMDLKTSYNCITGAVSGNVSHEDLTPGQLLFLALNTMFTNAENSIQDLQDSIKSCPSLPENWMKIEAVANTISLTKHVAEHGDLVELRALSMFLHRILAIRDFFAVCIQAARLFKTPDQNNGLGQTMPTGDDLVRPIKSYIEQLYLQQIAGLAARSLVSLICHQAQTTTSINLTEVLTLQEAAMIDNEIACLDSFFSWSYNMEVARHMEVSIEAISSVRQAIVSHKKSYQWLHEGDLLIDGGPLFVPLASNFMLELRQIIAGMMILRKELEIHEIKFQEIYETVEQRLKWASGANPELQGVFDSFATVYNKGQDCVRGLLGVMKSVSSVANTVLHFEALRTPTPEAITSDGNFMSLLSECQQSAALKESHIQSLSDVELRLFELCPPVESIDLNWIQAAYLAVKDLVAKTQEQIKVEGGKSKELIKGIQEYGMTIRSIITEHQKLMSDAGILLRTISKSEDFQIPEVNDYLTRYKEFSELVSKLVNGLALDDQGLDALRAITSISERLGEIIQPIYQDMTHFATLLKEDNLEKYKVKKIDGQSADSTGGPNTPEKKATSEEKNAFALNVLRRVRIKLDGREPDALKKSSVAEQVDFIIREATSLDNLALMYEGWTAWI
eukprot:TCALIF_05224-PA protein Name:"Similar to Smg1 Serine/threonine-protein kinase SMG1 (Mus musculus)" AED:0.14 eAED:0.15 QI:0/0.66/0.5/1/0/0/4/861/3250